jgi:alkylation response protein AidB-like acyl-CoA dehydrogenase
VHFAWTEEQEELRAQARAFLAEHSSSEAVRAAMASELGYEPALWKKLGSELGWTALSIPEEYGGLGLTAIEQTALLEETGRALLCSPYFATHCLAAPALLVAGSEDQKQEWLPGIADGEIRAALAWSGRGTRPDASGVELIAERRGADYVLRGASCYVVDGSTADLVIAAARASGSSGERGLSLFALAGNARGLRREALVTMDQTRRQAHLYFEGVEVSAAARLGAEGESAAALREVLDRAAIALAAEQIGGAQACLDMAVAYAKQREQFGRPIGSFQAIKHKCADLLVQLESARSAAYYAGWAAARAPAELASAAALAKAACSEAYYRCAADNLQIHGGVGFTWEYDVHLHFKRARASASLLGGADHHRERIAGMIGLGEGAAA